MFCSTFASRRDPFALMRSMLRDFDGFTPTGTTQPVFPAVNVWQGEKAAAITAELPGIDPADIDISVKDNQLTLSGERKAPEGPEGARVYQKPRRCPVTRPLRKQKERPGPCQTRGRAERQK